MIVHDCAQGSEEWHLLRAGMPTASEFSNIITSKGDPSKSMQKYAMRLAAELYAGKPLEDFSGNGWTDRGKELEEDARSTYSFVTGQEVQEIGFVTDNHERYGCSPDGLIGEDGLAEFKCLKTENHVSLMLFYKKYGRCPADYVQQTQGQIYVTERLWCDLVFYHPELPMVVIRQEPDYSFMDSLNDQLLTVIEERNSIFKQIQEF